jgi:putative toxin-antitoxin system antitoxin component (TIGR02293 family)
MVNELEAIVSKLGGQAAIGRRLDNAEQLRDGIREGLPQPVVEELMRSAHLTLKELSASLDLSARSLQWRREGRLARYESDRIYRLARTLALAKHYIGSDKRAVRWLRRPNRALGGAAPLDALDTELGARAVENILGRIAYGGIG